MDEIKDKKIDVIIYEWALSIIDIPEYKIKEVTHDFGIWFSHIKEETSQELAAKELIRLTNLNKIPKDKDYIKDLDEFQRHSILSFLNNLYAVNEVFK